MYFQLYIGESRILAQKDVNMKKIRLKVFTNNSHYKLYPNDVYYRNNINNDNSKGEWCISFDKLLQIPNLDTKIAIFELYMLDDDDVFLKNDFINLRKDIHKKKKLKQLGHISHRLKFEQGYVHSNTIKLDEFGSMISIACTCSPIYIDSVKTIESIEEAKENEIEINENNSRNKKDIYKNNNSSYFDKRKNNHSWKRFARANRRAPRGTALLAMNMKEKNQGKNKEKNEIKSYIDIHDNYGDITTTTAATTITTTMTDVSDISMSAHEQEQEQEQETVSIPPSFVLHDVSNVNNNTTTYTNNNDTTTANDTYHEIKKEETARTSVQMKQSVMSVARDVRVVRRMKTTPVGGIDLSFTSLSDVSPISHNSCSSHSCCNSFSKQSASVSVSVKIHDLSPDYIGNGIDTCNVHDIDIGACIDTGSRSIDITPTVDRYNGVDIDADEIRAAEVDTDIDLDGIRDCVYGGLGLGLVLPKEMNISLYSQSITPTHLGNDSQNQSRCGSNGQNQSNIRGDLKEDDEVAIPTDTNTNTNTNTIDEHEHEHEHENTAVIHTDLELEFDLDFDLNPHFNEEEEKEEVEEELEEVDEKREWVSDCGKPPLSPILPFTVTSLDLNRGKLIFRS